MGWRIIPDTRLLHAVEGYHDHTLWRFAVKVLSFAAANDKVVTALEWRHSFRDLLSVLFDGSEVRSVWMRSGAGVSH